MKQYQYTRNHHDLGPSDWSAHLPLGVTPPLAAQVIETWLRLEHPEVVDSCAQTVRHSGQVSIRCKPPTATLPWRFTYRAVGASISASDVVQAFISDPDGIYFGDMDGLDLDPEQPERLQQGASPSPMGGDFPPDSRLTDN